MLGEHTQPAHAQQEADVISHPPETHDDTEGNETFPHVLIPTAQPISNGWTKPNGGTQLCWSTRGLSQCKAAEAPGTRSKAEQLLSNDNPSPRPQQQFPEELLTLMLPTPSSREQGLTAVARTYCWAHLTGGGPSSGPFPGK